MQTSECKLASLLFYSLSSLDAFLPGQPASLPETGMQGNPATAERSTQSDCTWLGPEPATPNSIFLEYCQMSLILSGGHNELWESRPEGEILPTGRESSQPRSP